MGNWKRDLTKLIIIDLEGTCWEDENPPPGERTEIIEIGINVFDLVAWAPGYRASIIVKPLFSTVSPYCTKLTGYTQADVDGGVSFETACEFLRSEFRSEERIWASWSTYDLQQFIRQCNHEAVRYPFGADHWNLMALFSISMGYRNFVGLKKALKILGLTMQGTHHRGIDDAHNTARILQRMELRIRD